jgi:two-component system, sensor histidine kinase and response regulator
MNAAVPDKHIKILLVDDNEDAYVLTAAMLAEIETVRYRVDYVYRYEDAVLRINRNEHDVYLVDFFLGAKNGLDLISEVRAQGCRKPIICVTSTSNHLVDLSVMKAGASDFIVKGELSAGMLDRSIRYAIAQQQALNTLQATTEELLKANEKLEASKAELTESSRLKDKLFSIISHDLRSPFTALLGFSEMLASYCDELSREEIHDSAQRIYESGKNFHHLLENLLQWSRLQAGKQPCIPARFSITSLVWRVFSLYQSAADKKNILLHSAVEGSDTLRADETMVQAIIENLVSNAIKFTHSGGSVKVASRVDDAGVVFSIIDSGVGMDKETLDSLFTLDQHASRRGTNAEQGTGLGLLICHELVLRNNGSITVASRPGEGTTFTIQLPVAPESALPDIATPHSQPAQQRQPIASVAA